MSRVIEATALPCGCNLQDRTFCDEGARLLEKSDAALQRTLEIDGIGLFDDIPEVKAFRDHIHVG